jgi:CheY-like chemotaxis protein
MRKLHVLLVEDNEGDVLLMEEGLSRGRISPDITVMTDGWEAIQFIEKKGKYQDAVTPDFVMLDINLPKMNGHEVLAVIKSNPATLHIPVVMFTTSSYEDDIQKSYAGHANCYITKPMDVNDFIQTITLIADFWLGLVNLPVKFNN